ncbi:MAG: SpoIID/LytB domain-containing protein [Solirubrobacteraceae bacterium]
MASRGCRSVRLAGHGAAVLISVALALAAVAPARAASLLYIRGGGYGHGIGMSQYGAYGYALHGLHYQQILTHYYQGTSIGTIDSQQPVRVLLATGSGSFSGATRVAGSRVALQASSTYSVVPLSGARLELTTVAGERVGSFAAPLEVSGPAPLEVSGLGTYRGSLQFTPDGAGVDTVDVVGLDDYVRGVVAAEMPASWAPAALEAQAVAARTYAITTSVGAANYDLYDDTRSQVYGGVAAETPQTNAAVAATSGQIVTYDGKPAVTYFFASSGGWTESLQDAWPGATPEPWLRAVPDPYDSAGGDPYHSWSRTLGLPAATARLGALVHGRLIGIVAHHDGRSPRVVTADVVCTGGTVSATGAQLESLLGLDSTLASFTTITTQDPGGSLSGSIFPSPRAGTTVAVQRLARGWHTVVTVALSPSGTFRTTVAPGRYRIAYGRLRGPATTIP